MSDITIFIDGVEIKAQSGQTILEAAENAGVYIPRLCSAKGLTPHGSCRVCTVIVNGSPQSACTQPVAEGMIVENETDQIKEIRQALAYRFGIAAPRYPFLFPKRELDATHPDIFIDRNRCILCARCIRASRDIDGKGVFEFIGRGPNRRVAVNAEANLADTDVAATDKAIDICPVGALFKKRVGYATPVGQRKYDHKPIGSEIEVGKGSE